MSFVIAAPEALVAVASDLAGIGSALAEANAAALAPTTALLAAGADEVSAAIAALFGAHGQAYQTVSAQASAFHAQFVQALTGGGGAYAAAEAANVSAAQSTDQRLLDLINGPTQALLGRPLIGDGANGGPGQDGGPGGLLYGNGGNGGTSTTAGVAGGNGGAAGLDPQSLVRFDRAQVASQQLCAGSFRREADQGIVGCATGDIVLGEVVGQAAI